MEENITSKVEDLVDDSNDKTSKEIDPYVDVLGNGQIKKKVLKKGKDDTRPNRGDICTINIVGTLDDGTVAERYNDLTIQIGDMEVVQGLDLTIVLMDLGEIAEIIIHPRFAYGACGNDPIPPNATITYTVELKAIEPQPEIENMSINQRREISNKKRERGNWWFIRKDAICAVQCYRRALEYLTPNTATSWNEKVEVETTDAELQALLDDRIKVYNNLAAALMEKGSFYEALDHLEQVLKYQPTNVKALYRKAKIYAIRKYLGLETVIAYQAHKFETPSTAPPKIINLEVVEVDTREVPIIHLRWQSPLLPLNGKLRDYGFCIQCECNRTRSICFRD
ncbi:peptidyl-prolyl cis-trans isomerase FKBP8 [Pogonomyrmex barbatus]|uniref:peptidylprolyl isomerase n=1 Tax=Pogonomyrmex barbatus TaxID=144034 RepID=A0A6I9WC49_9HYME|nr:peptidyl-prolyl cis-trans isomerase FKBP8 [Pogonomyrmex barbatus]